MKIMQYTQSEIEAWKLLMRAGEIPLSTDSIDYHVAGNRIIYLAERIKAERNIIGMDKEE
jgi:hypothetical protein